MRARKLIVLGDFGVGKTSLIRRYVHDSFDADYHATLGVQLHKHVDTVPTGASPVELSMVLWDIEGTPLPGEQTLRYMAGASGALVVGDLARPDRLAPMRRMADMFEGARPGRPLAFALNKADLVPEGDEEGAGALRRRYGAPVLTTSALTGARVLELFRSLGARALEVEP